MLETLLVMALHLHGVHDTTFAHCVVTKESDWQVNATGKAGEIGLAQIMPSTARWWAAEMGWGADWDTSRLYDPSINLYMLAWALSRGYAEHWSTATACR